MKKLTIGYSVLADRAKNITLPNSDHWELLIIVQGGASKQNFPGAKLIKLPTFGVAKSRNATLANATTEYLVFADDDIVFQKKGLESAVNYLDQHPELALVLCQATDTSGRLRKKYPNAITKLGVFNSAKAATYEMMVRLSEIKKLGLRFDERFGAGTENYLGDEYIFIVDLLRAGGRADFLPITIATHPETSSGSKWGTKQDRLARARVFSRVFGAFSPIVRLTFGVRRLDELGGFGNLLRFVLGR